MSDDYRLVISLRMHGELSIMTEADLRVSAARTKAALAALDVAFMRDPVFQLHSEQAKPTEDSEHAAISLGSRVEAAPTNVLPELHPSTATRATAWLGNQQGHSRP